MWLLIVVLGVIAFFLLIALFQWLWNITIPELFGLKHVRYWQAFRLLLIAQVMFGSATFGWSM